METEGLVGCWSREPQQGMGHWRHWGGNSKGRSPPQLTRGMRELRKFLMGFMGVGLWSQLTLLTLSGVWVVQGPLCKGFIAVWLNLPLTWRTVYMWPYRDLFKFFPSGCETFKWFATALCPFLASNYLSRVVFHMHTHCGCFVFRFLCCFCVYINTTWHFDRENKLDRTDHLVCFALVSGKKHECILWENLNTIIDLIQLRNMHMHWYCSPF